MAVPKSKISRSRRGSRRSGTKINLSTQLSKCPETGDDHIRHHMTAEGFYKGINILKNKKKLADDE